MDTRPILGNSLLPGRAAAASSSSPYSASAAREATRADAAIVVQTGELGGQVCKEDFAFLTLDGLLETIGNACRTFCTYACCRLRNLRMGFDMTQRCQGSSGVQH